MVDTASDEAIKNIVQELLKFEDDTKEEMDSLMKKVNQQSNVSYANEDALEQEVEETLTV